MTDKVYLIRRGDFMDIMIDNNIVGKSSWRLIDTACYFYARENFDIKVIE